MFDTYHNHIDTGDIIKRLDRILFELRRDNAAQVALVQENEDLHKQLSDILTGHVLPPEVQEKFNDILIKIKAGNERLKKLVEENTHASAISPEQ